MKTELMNETKHTPGPWVMSVPFIWQPHGEAKPRKYREVGNAHGHVCEVAVGTESGAANARLILAAPELLQACEMFANSGHLESCPDKLRAFVLNAIAKATQP